jgi:radical SAM protein with 4Fe4S-binding SPASM domain
MIRFTQLIHGRGTVSEAMKHRHQPPGEIPSRLLAFSEERRPVIFWNMTNRCNLSCSHCYIRAGPENNRNDELTTEEAKEFIDDLASMHVPLILLSGGEPLMRSDFWQLQEYAVARGIKTALSTNGTLITPDVARRLQKSGIEYVGISLDGACAETHDALRNAQGSFVRSVRALQTCIALGLHCGVRVTVTRDNMHEISNLIDLSREIGVQRFCIYWLVPSGRGKALHDAKQLTPRDVEDILDVMYRRAIASDPGEMEYLTVDAPQDSVWLLDRLQADGMPAYDDACTLLRYMGGGCSAGDRVANVDPAGNVYPCQFAQRDEFRLGNIRERKFSAIWRDPDHPILAAFRRKSEALQGRCGDCTAREICNGGCRIRAYERYGDLRAEDPFCIRKRP